ncbi:MAG: HAD hydrolase-like protein [Lachnospiraceae bacterium]|nr:HAD hydrolase-like protein [Lachnospiraceae bacterium]
MNYIFDVDGTLWDTTVIVAKAWNDAVEDVGLKDKLGRFVTADMLKKEFGKPMDVIIDDLFPGESDELKEKIMVCVKEHEQKCVSECTDDLSYPGVVKTLKKLVKSSKLYIVSNCQDGYIPLVMGKLGITEIISDYECFGASGLLKADNIRLIMKRNGIRTEEARYIGDTFGDYDSAREAGVSFIYASYGFGDDKPCPEYEGLSISSFEELEDL